MPSGAIHARDSRVLAVVTFIPVALATQELMAASLVSVGCLSGIALSPDLDHHKRTYAERQFVIGKLWSWFWLPYEKFVPHRSVLSHGPVLGTVLRQLYLIAILWGVAYLMGFVREGLVPTLIWLGNVWLYRWWLIGLLLSDTIHWAQDVRPKLRARRGRWPVRW